MLLLIHSVKCTCGGIKMDYEKLYQEILNSKNRVAGSRISDEDVNMMRQGNDLVIANPGETCFGCGDSGRLVRLIRTVEACGVPKYEHIYVVDRSSGVDLDKAVQECSQFDYSKPLRELLHENYDTRHWKPCNRVVPLLIKLNQVFEPGELIYVESADEPSRMRVTTF